MNSEITDLRKLDPVDLAREIYMYEFRDPNWQDHTAVSENAYRRVREFSISHRLTISRTITFLLEALPNPTRFVQKPKTSLVNCSPDEEKLLAPTFELPEWIRPHPRYIDKEHQVSFFNDALLYSKFNELKIRRIKKGEAVNALLIHFLPAAKGTYPLRRRKR